MTDARAAKDEAICRVGDDAVVNGQLDPYLLRVGLAEEGYAVVTARIATIGEQMAEMIEGARERLAASPGIPDDMDRLRALLDDR